MAAFKFSFWKKVYETLKIYASLRGYEGEELENVLDEQIVGLQLAEYRDKWCGTLSGGNKRKVSVAIALIGWRKNLQRKNRT